MRPFQQEPDPTQVGNRVTDLTHPDDAARLRPSPHPDSHAIHPDSRVEGGYGEGRERRVAAAVRSLDAERRNAQAGLEATVGEGRLTLDAFTDRCGRIWAAESSREIARTLDDLPAPLVGHIPSARSTLVSVIGDIRRRGRWSLRRQTTVWLVLGDVELDLRGALVAEDSIEIYVYALVGDVQVVVPEGVEMNLTGLTLLGDRRIELAPVPRVPGTPVVRVRVVSLIGDAVVRSAS